MDEEYSQFRAILHNEVKCFAKMLKDCQIVLLCDPSHGINSSQMIYEVYAKYRHDYTLPKPGIIFLEGLYLGEEESRKTAIETDRTVINGLKGLGFRIFGLEDNRTIPKNKSEWSAWQQDWRCTAANPIWGNLIANAAAITGSRTKIFVCCGTAHLAEAIEQEKRVKPLSFFIERALNSPESYFEGSFTKLAKPIKMISLYVSKNGKIPKEIATEGTPYDLDSLDRLAVPVFDTYFIEGYKESLLVDFDDEAELEAALDHDIVLAKNKCKTFRTKIILLPHLQPTRSVRSRVSPRTPRVSPRKTPHVPTRTPRWWARSRISHRTATKSQRK